jgi:hypothetical protein
VKAGKGAPENQEKTDGEPDRVPLRERLCLQEDLQLREELLVQRREMSTPR